MAENKTKPTDASVDDYIASRASEQQRADCQALMALLKKVTGQPARMWGPSIVGYGSYRYTYANGRTSDIMVPLTEAVVEKAIPTTETVRQVQINRDSAAIAEFEEK